MSGQQHVSYKPSFEVRRAVRNVLKTNEAGKGLLSRERAKAGYESDSEPSSFEGI